jgi:TonB family protein
MSMGVMAHVRTAVVALSGVALACSRAPAQGTPSSPRRTPIFELANHSEVPPDEISGDGDAGPSVDGGLSAADASIVLDETCQFATPLPLPPRRKKPRPIYSGPPITNYIPPEVIMRPIRARNLCIRACYEAGLRGNPSLSGKVIVDFVVEEDGNVRAAHVAEGTDLPDKDVAACVARVFVGLLYPSPPEGRSVRVHYPIAFSP